MFIDVFAVDDDISVCLASLNQDVGHSPQMRKKVPFCTMAMFKPLVKTRDDVRRLKLDKTRMRAYIDNDEMFVRIILVDRSTIANYSHVSKLIDRDCFTWYWYSIDGTVFAFQNMTIFESSYNFVDTNKELQDLENTHVRTSDDVWSMIHLFRSDFTLVKCINGMSRTWLPYELRVFLFCIIWEHFEITDQTIAYIGFLFVDTHENDICESRKHAIWYVCRISKCMQHIVDKGTCEGAIVQFVRDVKAFAKEDHTILKWCSKSDFVGRLLVSLSDRYLLRVFKLDSAFVLCTALALKESIGKWTNEHYEKAKLVMDWNCDVEEVCLEWSRLQKRADCAATEFLVSDKKTDSDEKNTGTHASVQQTRDTPSPPRPSSPQHVETQEPLPETNEPTPHLSHRSALKEIAAAFGLDCFLIGTGILSSCGDIDLVVRVDGASTLSEAYDWVAKKTGWSLNKTVTGDDVAILSGTYNGTSIDAQVWRGADVPDKTRSEMQSEYAIEFWKRVSAETTPYVKRCIRLLHKWTEVARIKNHRLCQLPGIAITCIAIVLGSRHGAPHIDDASCICKLLVEFKSILDSDVPMIDMDSQTYNVENIGINLDGSCPLNVMMKEQNVASRLSACSHRYVRAVTAFALSLSVDKLLDGSAYDSWREASMFRCIRASPGDNKSSLAATTLRAIVADFDCHPLVDYLWLDECKETMCISVYAHIRDSASVSKYGFRSGDTIQVVSDSCVEVTRGCKTWLLMTSPTCDRNCVDDVVKCCKMTDAVRVTGMYCVPNAPFLTCEITAKFSCKGWYMSWQNKMMDFLTNHVKITFWCSIAVTAIVGARK